MDFHVPSLTSIFERTGQGLRALFGIVFVAIALGLVTNVIPLSLHSHHESSLKIGTLAMMIPLGFVVATFMIPFILDRLGIRLILTGAGVLLGLILSAALAYDLTDFVYLIEFFQGVTAALIITTARVAFLDAASKTMKAVLIAIFGSMMDLGCMGGTALIDLTGSSGVTMHILFLCSLAIGIFFFLGLQPLAETPQQQEKKKKIGLFGFFGIIRLIPSLVIASFLIGMAKSSMRNFLPIFGESLGMTEGNAALLLSFALGGGIFLALPLGWIGDRYGHRAGLCFGGFLVLVFSCVIPFGHSVPYLIWIAAAMLGGSIEGTAAVAMAVFSEREGINLAQALAAFAISGKIGAVTGPALAGMLIHVSNPASLFIIIGTSALVTMTVAFKSS
jgi:MFS family permease